MNRKIPQKQPMELNVFLTLSNPIGMSLFRYIASNGGWYSSDLISSLNCSRKQFYFNMNRLKQIGLVRKIRREYSLSPYGKLVNNVIQIIDGSLMYKDPLILLDENREKYTQEIWEKMAETLIPNPTIRQLAFH